MLVRQPQTESVLIYLSCRFLAILTLSLAQLNGQSFGHSLTGSAAQSNLPDVLVRQVQPPGNVGNYAAYFGCLSEFSAQRSKIHGGYQLSKKAIYAEPRMNVNKKTRLRVSAADRPEIAEAFRLARKNLGLTQSELAEELGSSQGAITRWERGKDSPPVSALLALAELVPPAEKGFWISTAGFHTFKISPYDVINSGVLESPIIKAATGVPWDPELLAWVIEAIEAGLKGRARPDPDKYASAVIACYEVSHRAGIRDAAMVSSILKVA